MLNINQQFHHLKCINKQINCQSHGKEKEEKQKQKQKANKRQTPVPKIQDMKINTKQTTLIKTGGFRKSTCFIRHMLVYV